MDPAARPFSVVVALPGGRTFDARVELAVVLCPTRTSDPDRLTLRLPPAGLAATEQLLSRYAAAWGFPMSAVEDWRRGAERRAGSDRDYSTHVFTPDAVGFVHLEFQVSHHVSERDFVTTVLLSWPG